MFYIVSQKTQTNFCPHVCKILLDFPNSFTGTRSGSLSFHKLFSRLFFCKSHFSSDHLHKSDFPPTFFVSFTELRRGTTEPEQKRIQQKRTSSFIYISTKNVSLIRETICNRRQYYAAKTICQSRPTMFRASSCSQVEK